MFILKIMRKNCDLNSEQENCDSHFIQNRPALLSSELGPETTRRHHYDGQLLRVDSVEQ